MLHVPSHFTLPPHDPHGSSYEAGATKGEHGPVMAASNLIATSSLGAVSGFGNSNTDIVVDGKTQKVSTNIKSIGFGPGYTIFSNNCIALEAQVKYNLGSTKSSVDIAGINQTTNSKNNAFDFVVGVSYYFGR